MACVPQLSLLEASLGTFALRCHDAAGLFGLHGPVGTKLWIALARSLEENLEASKAGVLIWSTRSEDSDWCKREYDSFLTLQTERGFRFVIARLTGVKLTLFARNAIWEDFSEQRDGPSGTALLRLLYGLSGKPIPAAAVRRPSMCPGRDLGWAAGTRLSPTSEVMVEASDEMIAIGGGAIARDELNEARRRGKPIAFFPAEMNHALATEKARKSGTPPPTDFRGEAHAVFNSP